MLIHTLLTKFKPTPVLLIQIQTDLVSYPHLQELWVSLLSSLLITNQFFKPATISRTQYIKI